MKRGLKFTLRWFWGTVATLIIGFALLLQLGRVALPYAADWRASVQFYLQGQLGHEISLGALEANWEGLSPEVALQQFSIRVDGSPSLQIEQAVVKLNLLRSLLALDWRFGRMEVNGVHARLQQSADGRWSLYGYEPARRKVAINPLELPLMADFAHLQDIRLTFQLRSDRLQGLRLSNLLLQNDLDFHRISAELDLPDKNDTLTFVYEGEGIPGSIDAWGEGYLVLDEYSLAQAAAFASESVADLPGVRDGLLSARLWLHSAGEDQLTFEGSLDYRRQESEDSAVPESIATQLTGRWHRNSGWEIGLRDLRSRWMGRDSEPLNAHLSGGFERDNIDVQIEQLDLGHWLALAGQSPAVPEVAQRVLGELNVQGSMQNLTLSVPLRSPQEFNLSAYLQSVSLNDWKGAPQVADLNGYLDASALSGAVQIDSRDHFTMHFPKIYRLPFEFDSALGEVAWQISPENNQVLVNSGRLALSSEMGNVNGYFYLDAPLERGARFTDLILQLGIKNSAALYRGELMPKLVPGTIQAWVDRAVIAASIPAAGLVLRGQFGKLDSDEDPTPRAIQLALDSERAVLRFDERWPELQNFSGRLYMDAPELSGRIANGRFIGTDIQQALIELQPAATGQGLHLTIQGALEGDASAGLSLLTTTPLRETLGDAFDRWQLNGSMKAGVELEIPLSGGAGNRQEVVVDLVDADLDLATLDLRFTDLDTQLKFSSEQGLSAKKISAALWGEPVTAQLSSSRKTAEEPWRTLVAFRTAQDVEQLAYRLQRPELLFLQGKPLLRGNVTVQSGVVRLQATTDLQGVKVDLPAPFGKTAEQQRPLDFSMPIADNGFSLKINYSDRLFANFEVPAQEPLFGSVSLGVERPAREGGVWIEGEIENLNGRQWLPLLQRYGDYSELINSRRPEVEAVQNNEVAVPALRLDARVNNFRWDDWQFTGTRVSGGQVDAGWAIRLDNEQLAGDILLFSDARAPVIDLDFLHWQSRPDASEADQSPLSDPLQDFNPQQLEAFSLRVDELTIDSESFGKWSMDVLPREDGILVDNIHAEVRNLAISGRAGDEKNGTAEGAQLLWLKGPNGEWTRFDGIFRGKNLADVTDAWQLPRLLESKSIFLDSDLTWTGSPAMFSVQELDGNLNLDIREGRFYQSTGQASSAFLRLVGLFNFDNWTRRLQLDFSDLYSGGLPFDRVTGKLRFESGMIYLDEPLEVKNTSAKMLMGGRINLRDETLDASLVATLPVGGNATLITALIAGLPAAAGVYVASKLFEKQVDKVASLSYRMDGSWADPNIKFDKLFDNKAADKASKDGRIEGRSSAPDAATSP